MKLRILSLTGIIPKLQITAFDTYFNILAGDSFMLKACRRLAAKYGIRYGIIEVPAQG
jgi:hypothetical protein